MLQYIFVVYPAFATNGSPRVIGPKILIRAPGLTNLGDHVVSQHHSDTNDLSGAAKVDFSPESCILLRKHETLHKCSLVPIDHLKK